MERKSQELQKQREELRQVQAMHRCVRKLVAQMRRSPWPQPRGVADDPIFTEDEGARRLSQGND
jgi:hypothetical protein